MGEDDLLVELRAVADELEAIEARKMDLHDQRLKLTRIARGLDPPVVWTKLADASRVTGAALKQALKRDTDDRTAPHG